MRNQENEQLRKWAYEKMSNQKNEKFEKISNSNIHYVSVQRAIKISGSGQSHSHQLLIESSPKQFQFSVLSNSTSSI